MRIFAAALAIASGKKKSLKFLPRKLNLAVPLEETLLYDFQENNIDGELVDFGERYAGRVTIVTNVASE